MVPKELTASLNRKHSGAVTGSGVHTGSMQSLAADDRRYRAGSDEFGLHWWSRLAGAGAIKDAASKPLLTKKQAAERMGVSIQTVNRWVQR